MGGGEGKDEDGKGGERVGERVGESWIEGDRYADRYLLLGEMQSVREWRRMGDGRDWQEGLGERFDEDRG